MKPVIAAFDFDGTITTRDMLFSFLCQLHTYPQIIYKSLILLPTLLAYKSGYLNNHTAKQRLLNIFMKNLAVKELQCIAEKFAHEKIPLCIRPEALNRIRWHQAQHHQCMLISAGLEIYLQPWAKTVGFDQVIATRLQVTEGKISGLMEGQNCFGQEKVNRLLNIAGSRENFTLYAYGDSRGDQELLAIADYKFYQHMPV